MDLALDLSVESILPEEMKESSRPFDGRSVGWSGADVCGCDAESEAQSAGHQPRLKIFFPSRLEAACGF